MKDKIINLVKDQATKHFVEKTDVPNDKAEEAAVATGESIYESLKEQILDGDFKGVKNMLSGKKSGDLKQEDGVKKIVEKVSGKIREKVGVDKETADKAAETAVPDMVEKVSEKFESKDDADADFDLKDMFEMILSEDGREELLEKAKVFFDGLSDKIMDTIEELTTSLGGLLSGFGGLFGGDDKDDKKKS